MRKTWTYRWAGSFYALVLVACLISLPSAIKCCSRFSPQEDAYWRNANYPSNYGWFAKDLLNWPSGFRLLVMTIVAATLCLLATFTLYLIARHTPDNRDARNRPTGLLIRFIVRAAVASFTTAVLYVLMAWLLGYIGRAPGPDMRVMMLTIAALIGLQEVPGPLGLLLAIPLFLSGLIFTALISLFVGIPLD